jgi:hypothetical protein
VGGSITARKVKARTIDLRSVGGPLRVLDSESDRVSMQALEARSSMPAGSAQRPLRPVVAGGQVLVTPTGNDGFEVDVMTLDGNFRSDFPLTLRERRGPPEGRGGLRRGTAVSGTFGEGGGLLTLRSATGGVTIRRP